MLRDALSSSRDSRQVRLTDRERGGPAVNFASPPQYSIGRWRLSSPSHSPGDRTSLERCRSQAGRHLMANTGQPFSTYCSAKDGKQRRFSRTRRTENRCCRGGRTLKALDQLCKFRAIDLLLHRVRCLAIVISPVEARPSCSRQSLKCSYSVMSTIPRRSDPLRSANAARRAVTPRLRSSSCGSLTKTCNEPGFDSGHCRRISSWQTREAALRSLNRGPADPSAQLH